MDVNLVSLCSQFVRSAVVSAICIISFSACAQSSDFQEIDDVSEQERHQILEKYNYLDPENVIPTKALANALVYFDKNQNFIKNKNYLAVIDFSKNSAQKRFYIVNMNNGVVWNIHVAHGRGSDRDHDGQAESFGNEDGSFKSSVGYYLTGETYYGDHGRSLRLDGLSKTNSNARKRAVVIHGADYVREADVKQGRSLGCPAVDPQVRDTLIDAIKDGGLIYAAH